MKKTLLILILLSVAIIMTSCSKAEEVTISKYFQAMKVGEAGDKDTMTSMAINPKHIKFDKYEIVSISEPVIEPILLPTLNQNLADVNQKKKDVGLSAQEANDAILDLEDELADARSSSKKRELKKQLEEANVNKVELVANFKDIIIEKKRLEKQIEFEQMLMKTSAGRSKMPNIEMYKGDSYTSKVDIKVTLPTKEIVDYVFILKKYVLKLEEKELPRNRLLITEIMTAADYAESIEEVIEEPENTEEVTEEQEATENQ
ncbi:MAG: hypothetical protein ABFR36_10370 [Acidobacteriota bacterium]